MATISKTILPIPESVVVGSGSYTVPSNKYGFLVANMAATAAGHYSTAIASASAASNSVEQWLAAGTSITVSTSAPGATGVSSAVNWTAYAQLGINGTTVGIAKAQGYLLGASSGLNYASNANVGWSVSLFPIPVNNLPDSLIT